MIAAQHLRGWARISEARIVALCDVDPAMAEKRRTEFVPDARVYTDVATLLVHEQLDFVDVLTPPAHHAAHVRMAAARGLHVICQKPLTADLDEARALVQDLRSHPGLFIVHENHRFRPWFQDVQRRHAAGFFGRPRYLRFEQLDPYEPKEAFKAAAAHGVMLEYGTHLVDMMRALWGEPRRVYARLHRQNPRVAGDSLAHAVYEYEDATAVIDIAWKRGGAQQGSFLLVGEEGEAHYEGRMTRGERARLRLMRDREVVLDEPRIPTNDYDDSFFLLQRGATLAMLGRGPVPQPAADNLRTLECSLAPYQSATNGSVVDCPGE